MSVLNLKEFIEVWNNANSKDEVAEKFGKTTKDAEDVASFLSKTGFTMKNLSAKDDADFIAIWNKSTSKKDVAERLNTTIEAADERAKELRNKGINLKFFKIKASNEEFIHAWNEAASVEDVAKKFGMVVADVDAKMKRLRRCGVEFKLFGNDITKMHAEIAKELNDEVFVQAWNKALSAEDVAKEFNISAYHAARKAYKLRDKGFIIKKFKKSSAV